MDKGSRSTDSTLLNSPLPHKRDKDCIAMIAGGILTRDLLTQTTLPHTRNVKSDTHTNEDMG